MEQYLRDFDAEVHRAECLEQGEDLDNFSVETKFKIIHNNIRSIEKNFDEFKIVLRIYSEKFHVIVLS